MDIQHSKFWKIEWVNMARIYSIAAPTRHGDPFKLYCRTVTGMDQDERKIASYSTRAECVAHAAAFEDACVSQDTI